jgi:SAM-dependent methyltransferase
MSDWDEVYRSKPALWSGRPGPLLVRELTGLAPGHALELGCGEGADALWLAGEGWRVDGLDISTVALERADARARELGLQSRVHWQQQDLSSWRAQNVYDLVSVQFLHSIGLDREPILIEATHAVAPGGTLLIVSHRAVPHWSGLAEAPAQPSATELADRIGVSGPDWRIDLVDEVERTATHADGRTEIVSDSVLRATRR